MLKSVESAVSAFALMTLVCSFGLSVVIAAAGISKTKLAVPCGTCAVVAQADVAHLSRRG